MGKVTMLPEFDRKVSEQFFYFCTNFKKIKLLYFFTRTTPTECIHTPTNFSITADSFSTQLKLIS